MIITETAHIRLERGLQLPLVLELTQDWVESSGSLYSVSVTQTYKGSGSDTIQAEVVIRIMRQDIETMKAHDPRRALAFRGEVKIHDLYQRLKDRIIAVLTYTLPWYDIERFHQDVKLDMRAIRAWWEQLPHPAEVAVRTAAAP